MDEQLELATKHLRDRSRDTEKRYMAALEHAIDYRKHCERTVDGGDFTSHEDKRYWEISLKLARALEENYHLLVSANREASKEAEKLLIGE